LYPMTDSFHLKLKPSLRFFTFHLEHYRGITSRMNDFPRLLRGKTHTKKNI
jgi:hypothetical protein